MKRFMTCVVSCFLGLTTTAIGDQNQTKAFWTDAFSNGKPYRVAARCYAVSIWYPELVPEGDLMLLIIDRDPHLNADMRQQIVSGDSPRLNMVRRLFGEMALTATDLRAGFLDLNSIRAQCEKFAKSQFFK